MSEELTSQFGVNTHAWWYDHPEPPKDYREEIESLCRFAVRFEAWKKVLTGKNLRRLRRLKGCFLNFQEPFDELMADFTCTPEELRTIISKMLLVPKPIEFVRTDIYDSRAWCVLKLSDFVEFTGNDRAVVDDNLWRQCWQHSHDMPLLHFGVFNQPWTVSYEDFTVVERKKKYKRIAVMFHKNSQTDRRFHDKEGRWVAELDWPKGISRKEITDQLFAKTEERAAKSFVRIQPFAAVRRLNGERNPEMEFPAPYTRDDNSHAQPLS